MKKIIQYTIALVVFLLPLIFLPITQDYTEFNKIILLFFCSTCIILFASIHAIISKRAQVYYSPLTIPLILLFSVSLISTFIPSFGVFSPRYVMGSLLSMSGPLYLLCGFILFQTVVFLREDRKDDKTILYIKNALIAAGLVLSIFILFKGVETSFTPIGSPYTAFLFLFIPLSILISAILSTISSQNIQKTMIFVLGTTIIVAAQALILIQSLLKSLTLLSVPASVTILLNLWKNIPSLLLGFGPGSYSSAFTVGRPLWLNQTPQWNVLFSQSTTYLLTLYTELGLLAGLLMSFILIFSLLSGIKNRSQRIPALLPALFIVVLIHIIGISNITLLTFFFIIAASIIERKSIINLDLTKTNKIVWIFPSIGIIVSVLSFYFISQLYLSEMEFKQAIDAIKTNQGQVVYTKMGQAIKRNKYNDSYHRSFAQVNLALANSLSANNPVSDQDSQNIPKLIQQAIDEGNVAVSLNKTSTANWSNLAQIYVGISKFARGADKKAIESYKQAIILFPTDPQSRLILGRFYFSLGKYEDAATLFQEAINLKPNWANAHYNLALTYKQDKQPDKAYKELEETVKLLPPGSENINKIKREIESLK